MQRLIKVDRSRVQLALDCGRDRWWSYEWNDGPTSNSGDGAGSHGLTSSSSYCYHLLGNAVHGGCQALLQGDTLAGALRAADAVFAGADASTIALPEAAERGPSPSGGWLAEAAFQLAESRAIAAGLVAAYGRVRIPAILREYRCLAVEQEVQLTLHEDEHVKLVLMGRPDVFLERLSDGHLLVDEFKTLTTVRRGWIESWEHDLQLHLQTAEAREWLRLHGEADRPVAGIMVEGFCKGQRRRDKDSGRYRFGSPLAYGYRRMGDGLIADEIRTSWARGYTKALVTDMGIGVAEWVNDWLPEEEVQAQLVVVPPIRPSEWLTAASITQIVKQELRLVSAASAIRALPYDGREEALAEFFPMNTKTCWRFNRCGRYKLCFEHQAGLAPLEAGYQRRVVNHPTELSNDD